MSKQLHWFLWEGRIDIEVNFLPHGSFLSLPGPFCKQLLLSLIFVQAFWTCGRWQQPSVSLPHSIERACFLTDYSLDEARWCCKNLSRSSFKACANSCKWMWLKRYLMAWTLSIKGFHFYYLWGMWFIHTSECLCTCEGQYSILSLSTLFPWDRISHWIWK